MDFSLTPQDATFLDRFRSYLDGLKDEGYYASPGLARPDHAVDPVDVAARDRFIRRLGADGWLGLSWPTEFGGRGLAGTHQWLMLDELESRGLPAMFLGVLMVGPTLLRCGSDDQKVTYLPKILAGEFEFCLGYSEPGAGTDLANLQTRAVRDGDEYVINGQKIYTTGAQYATHVWLAARTGPTDSRHKGVSVFIVPLDTPGITVRPLTTAADYRTNEVFYENVRVPKTQLVGAENDGWRVIAMALDLERIPTANRIVRMFGNVASWALEPGSANARPADDLLVRAELGRLSADLSSLRLFSMKIAGMVANGVVPSVEASMAKIWYSEYAQRLTGDVLSMMGQSGAASVGANHAPLEGQMELSYRETTVTRFAAGTNEVQRDIIAQRGLGLPRNRR